MRTYHQGVRCLAGPQMTPRAAEVMIEQFLRLGVPPRKLILGVPWFGRVFRCAAG